MSQGFDGVPSGSGVGQKGLDTRTKRIRHPSTYPLKCLKDREFRRALFRVLPYTEKCRVRQGSGLDLELMDTHPLKELCEGDFYLWVQENLKLLKNKEYGLVDWENLLRALQVGEFQIWVCSQGLLSSPPTPPFQPTHQKDTQSPP